MSKNIVGLFVDISNLYYCINKRFNGRKLDYKKYMEATIGNDDLYRAFAYGAQIEDEATNFIISLRENGYEPKYKRPKQYFNPVVYDFEEVGRIATLTKQSSETVSIILKNAQQKETRKADWDVGIAMDIVRLIWKLDIVIIGSADGDLAPLASWIREQGVKCIVYASGISRELKEACDEWYEVDENLLEGVKNGT